MFTQALVAAALALVAPLADAHMVLANPKPFFASGNPQNNGPLSSNYPCKQAGSSTYQFSFPRTEMAPGSKQNVSFIGSAVHGGGSCQLSLSKDLAPTEKSVFKVIHSIEGGCPARNTPGNLPADINTFADPNTYDYTIPSDLEAGQYTFAWTWGNKIGNREFYMSCAPITISGGKTKRELEPRDSSAFDKLPNMFLFNIDNVQCHTADSKDLQYPDPGTSVEKNNPSLAPPTGPIDTCYAGGKDSSGGSAPAPASSGPKPAGAAPAPAAAAPAAPAAPAPAPASGGQVPGAAAPSGMSGSGSGSSNAYTPPVAAAPVSGSGSCASGGQKCSTAGSVVCIGSTQFGLCDQTGCAIPQSLAAGTVCSGGKISRRGLRVSPHARRHAGPHKLSNELTSEIEEAVAEAQAADRAAGWRSPGFDEPHS
ncbi:MAG: hypothetical protein M1828_001685 [Chrysothrix sp. TS-e1954]|nr:MAG: hypothetical protein M1828_001685 [Chrysothrix sp. TS-e1954]